MSLIKCQMVGLIYLLTGPYQRFYSTLPMKIELKSTGEVLLFEKVQSGLVSRVESILRCLGPGLTHLRATIFVIGI